MIVYIAQAVENDYEEEWFNIGVYSTKENAEKATVNYLRNMEKEDVLSYEAYERMDNPNFYIRILVKVVDGEFYGN